MNLSFVLVDVSNSKMQVFSAHIFNAVRIMFCKNISQSQLEFDLTLL